MPSFCAIHVSVEFGENMCINTMTRNVAAFAPTMINSRGQRLKRGRLRLTRSMTLGSMRGAHAVAPNEIPDLLARHRPS